MIRTRNLLFTAVVAAVSIGLLACAKQGSTSGTHQQHQSGKADGIGSPSTVFYLVSREGVDCVVNPNEDEQEILIEDGYTNSRYSKDQVYFLANRDGTVDCWVNPDEDGVEILLEDGYALARRGETLEDVTPCKPGTCPAPAKDVLFYSVTREGVDCVLNPNEDEQEILLEDGYVNSAFSTDQVYYLAKLDGSVDCVVNPDEDGSEILVEDGYQLAPSSK